MLRKREINLSTLAFIDVMACGLGAVVLLFFILDFQEPAKKDENAKPITTRQNPQQKLALKHEKLNLKKTLILERIDAKTKELSDILVESLRVGLNTNKETERIEKKTQPSPESSKNEPSHLIGLSIEGPKILVVLDTSASMAHTRLIDIISGLGDSSGKRLEKGRKWKQAKQIGGWLIEQAPSSSSIRVLGYSDKITFSDASWNSPTNALQTYEKSVERIAPKGGTNLAVALEYISSNAYEPSNIYLITDGLPTLSGQNTARLALDKIGNGCFRLANANSYVDGDCRRLFFQYATENFRKSSGAKINVILLALEGDPEAAHLYQHWANHTGGTLFSPAASWLK